MAEFANTPINESSKESPTPQESPGTSTTPEADSDGKIKKARTTVILRDVDPAATEEQILALFDKTDLKVVFARPDVQNCWFVQLETEDMAKQAALHLAQQTLCGQPVKPRIKSEGTLRTSAPAWQPTIAPSALYPNQAYHQAAGFVAPAPAAGQSSFNNWTGNKPASINKPPPEGGFKKQGGSSISGGEAVPFVQGSNQQHSAGSGRGSGAKKGSGGQGRTSGGGDRKGRRGSQSGAQTTAPKQASFQPTDFPSLTGGSAPSAEPVIAAAPVQVQEAPANSWAARAKSTTEAAAPVQAKKKETVKAPTEVKEQQKAPRKETSQASESAEKAQAAPVQQEAANAVSAAPAAAKSPESGAQQQETGAAATEAKRRGWEKPGLPQVKKEASPPSTTNPSPSPPPETSKAPSGKSDVAAEKPSKDSKQQRQSGGSGGRRSASKEKGESNGHPAQPPPIVPLPWGNKSFAQVIKEAPAAQPAPAPAAASNNSTFLPSLKSNENWGDVEDDDLTPAGSAKSASAPRTGANASSRPPVGAQLEKLRPNSENSSDWRKDAAARRKNEEQATSGARAGGSKRPNGS